MAFSSGLMALLQFFFLMQVTKQCFGACSLIQLIQFYQDIPLK